MGKIEQGMHFFRCLPQNLIAKKKIIFLVSNLTFVRAINEKI